MIVDVVFEERYWYPHDGGQVWLAGYTPVDEQGAFLARDAPELHKRGIHITHIAGAAQHHDEALQQAELGQRLDLQRQPDNPHDPNAIAVFLDEAVQLGWVPRELAAAHRDAELSAIALRESRPSPRDPRTGMTMLLAPGPIELRVRAGSARPPTRPAGT